MKHSTFINKQNTSIIDALLDVSFESVDEGGVAFAAEEFCHFRGEASTLGVDMADYLGFMVGDVAVDE